MRSSSRAAEVVELFVRAVVAERRARELRGEATTLPPEVFDPPGGARASRLPPINVWWSTPDGIVH